MTLAKCGNCDRFKNGNLCTKFNKTKNPKDVCHKPIDYNYLEQIIPDTYDGFEPISDLVKALKADFNKVDTGGFY
jgi:hypothetical protein